MKIDAHCSASSMSKPDSFRDILSLHILVTDLPRIHLIDNFSYVVLLKSRRIVPVRNSGNQPYTTSGLATTRTLSETSPVFYSLEHYLFGPVACFNRL